MGALIEHGRVKWPLLLWPLLLLRPPLAPPLSRLASFLALVAIGAVEAPAGPLAIRWAPSSFGRTVGTSSAVVELSNVRVVLKMPWNVFE